MSSSRCNRRRMRRAPFGSLLCIAAGHVSLNYKMLMMLTSPEAKTETFNQ
jgi:hypothetical protein